jgi:Ni/Co efflux regulator RcnB
MTDRSRLTALAALALGVLGAAATAQAQPGRDRDGRGGRGGDRRAPPPPRYAPAHRPPPPPPHVYHQPPMVHQRPVIVQRPYVRRPMPREYLGHNYRIDNWSYYGLPAPSRGMFWVQYGGDFVMVSPNGIAIQIWGN